MSEQEFTLKVGERELKVEIKNLAEQANGGVFVRYGDTVVMTTCVMSKQKRENIDFFPLTVGYEERFYAAGKIRGARYIKRETRPSDKAICNGRVIDRAVRPLFPKNLFREVQIIVTVLSWDGQNDPAALGLLGASLALSISDIPWGGPVAVVKVGRKNDKFILNPTYKEKEESNFNILFSGLKKDGKLLINMMEGDFEEKSENLVLKALDFARNELISLCSFQEEIVKKIGKDKVAIEPPEEDPQLEKEIKNFLHDRLEKVVFHPDKQQRTEEMEQLKKELTDFIEEKYPEQEKTKCGETLLEKEIQKLVRESILLKEKRPDGRRTDQIRKISVEVGILPRTHGSGLFCRGQTKALSILTLGAPGDVQLLEGMEITGEKRFMHHYNFPPYSVGEVKPLRGPSRRDIGHGMLVEKALLPLIPSFDEFPYTMRVVSEILSSNGSTSMASVSSSSLALMDAGVPIKAPVAGIALGLVTDQKEDSRILTDIQGPEDHYGDMDFKLAGTKKGMTALQMDVKIEGIDRQTLERSLEQAKKARLEILEKMIKLIKEPRPELSPFAPRIIRIKINPERIRDVIGPGGKVINEIIEKTGVDIDIQPSGVVYVTSESENAAKKAVSLIKNITREVKKGESFQGKVTSVRDFGAFVEILPRQEGLIHISKLTPSQARKIKKGDILEVKVISIDDKGRINLSLEKNKKTKYDRPKKRGN